MNGRNTRVTRGWFSRLPRYSSSDPVSRTNWNMMTTLDWGVLAIGLLAAYKSVTWGAWVFGLSCLWVIVSIVVRSGRRARECERSAHQPYEAARGVWKCWHCDHELSGEELAESLRRQAYAARRQDDDDADAPQARWSDRR
jgi:ribosomal protein L37AE/L43A